MRKNYRRRKVTHTKGYRSGLEEKVSYTLSSQGIAFLYESTKIEWEDLTYRKYTPDFILPNGIIIETKGLFIAADRKKHLAVKEQHPDLDIRFVFTNSRSRLSKGAKSRYGDWCDKHGFLYSDKTIPTAWIKEKGDISHPALIKLPFGKLTRG
jgi:hypothetical protein